MIFNQEDKILINVLRQD